MLLFFFFFAFFQTINHRFWMSDFRVYYEAMHAYFSYKPVYEVCFTLGSGYYKYSPFALFLLYPFSIFEYDIAKIIYFTFTSAIIIFAVIFANSIIQKKLYSIYNIKPKLILLLLITIAFVQHIYFELHLGNINMLLLLLCLFALTLQLKRRPYLSGIMLAISILIKPHFIILIPLFFLRKQFRLIISLISTLFIGLFLPSLYTGVNINLKLLLQWKNVMLTHVNSPISAQDTIYSWLYRLTGSSLPEHLQFLFIISILSILAFLMLVFCIINLKNEKAEIQDYRTHEKNFVFEFFVLVALIPNITVTDSEHFLFSLPLITWLINYIFIRKPHIIFQILIVFVILLYDINIRELLGMKLSRWMTDTGILGLANLLIIIGSVYFFMKEKTIYQNKGELSST
jgi:hypothetical protein